MFKSILASALILASANSYRVEDYYSAPSFYYSGDHYSFEDHLLQNNPKSIDFTGCIASDGSISFPTYDDITNLIGISWTYSTPVNLTLGNCDDSVNYVKASQYYNADEKVEVTAKWFEDGSWKLDDGINEKAFFKDAYSKGKVVVIHLPVSDLK